MDESSVCKSLIKWLESFPGVSSVTAEGLSDGVTMGRVLHMIDESHFNAAFVSRLKEGYADNWRLKISNLRKVQQSMEDYLQYLGVQCPPHYMPDINKIGESSCPIQVGRMLQFILACAMNCPTKERHIESVMQMPAEVQAVVMNVLQTVFARETSPGVEIPPPGPASFHPNHRTITEQLETTTRARDEAVALVHELEMQLSEVADETKALKDENSKLMERLGELDDMGDMTSSAAASTASSGTVSRYKDLKKKIDSLQDDLFKVETSRDEYRSRVDQLEREHSEMIGRVEELQKLADQAHILQDEVDVLRDMGQRATLAETTIESYKKKLDELSDLKRQNKILEEKNADYMQHILELEEDVKKNDSWRPQLELFKKQTAELRQQLSEETKKADRLSFDNKKLSEKVEAITLEKERMLVERDTLKEHLEELRCQKSAQHSTTSGGGLLRDDLTSDPQDVWEKLMRLRHENEQLKRQQKEGGASEPVMQAVLNDLKESHENLSAENRWAYLPSHISSSTSPSSSSALCTTTAAVTDSSSPPRTVIAVESPTLSIQQQRQSLLSCTTITTTLITCTPPSSGFSYTNSNSSSPPPLSSSSPLPKMTVTTSSASSSYSAGSPNSTSPTISVLDVSASVDQYRRIRLLRKNLKWASESDLLILRKPSIFASLLTTAAMSSSSSSSPSSSKTLPTLRDKTDQNLSSTKLARPHSDGSQQQIIIRHIHEFKVGGSGGNVSVGAAAGFGDDSGCCRASPTSSNSYCGEDPASTLDSGVSGLYDCISPMIPSLAEDYCNNSQLISDIILPQSSSNATTPSTACAVAALPSSSNPTPQANGVTSPTHTMVHHTHCCCSLSPSHRLNAHPNVGGHHRCQLQHHSGCSPSRAGRSCCQRRTRSSSRGRKSGVGHSERTDAEQPSSSKIIVSPSHHRYRLQSPPPPDSPTPHNSPRVPTRGSSNSRNRRSSRSPSISRSSSRSDSRSSTSERDTEKHSSLYHQLQVSLSHDQKYNNCATGYVSSSDSLRSFKRSPTPDSEANSWRLVNLKNAYNVRESFMDKNVLLSNAKECLDAPPNGDHFRNGSRKSSGLMKYQENSVSADYLPVQTSEELKVCQSFAGLEVTPSTAKSTASAAVTPNIKKPVSVVRGVASAIRQINYQTTPHNVENNGHLQNMKMGGGRFSPFTSSNGKVSPKPNSAAPLETNFDSGCYETVSMGSPTPPRTPTFRLSRSASASQTVSVGTDPEPQSTGDSLTTPPMPKGSFDIETHFGMHDLSQDSEPVTVLKHKSPQHLSRANVAIGMATPVLKEDVIMNFTIQKAPQDTANIKPTVVGAMLKNDSSDNNRPIMKASPIQLSNRKFSNGSLRCTSLESKLANSPADRLPFRRTASVRVSRPVAPNQHRPLDDTTLHKSDTLFTHFVVSPKKLNGNRLSNKTVPSPQQYINYPLLSRSAAGISPKNRSLLVSYMESDSDEDVLEHRLVAGAYGAPLVSSDSSTSVMSRPDTYHDTDPSATDYNTDNGSDAYDFTPHQFRVSYDDIQRDKLQNQALLGSAAPASAVRVNHGLPSKTCIDSSPIAGASSNTGAKITNSQSTSKHSISSLPHRNSLTRIQEEDTSLPSSASAPHISGSVATPSSPPLSPTSALRHHANLHLASPTAKTRKQNKLLKSIAVSAGCVTKKKKHKTAKMVAAETFNAMFTFCAP